MFKINNKENGTMSMTSFTPFSSVSVADFEEVTHLRSLLPSYRDQSMDFHWKSIDWSLRKKKIDLNHSRPMHFQKVIL